MGLGLQPDILFARSEYPFPDGFKDKLALYSNIDKKNIIEALNVDSIYEVPINYKK